MHTCWGLRSHRAMQKLTVCFVWLSTRDFAIFLGKLWSTYLDVYRLICSLTIVCLPHSSIATSYSSCNCQIEAGRSHHDCLPPVAVETGESVAWRHRSPLVVVKDGESVALHHAGWFNDKYEDEGQTYVVYREMKMELSMTIETKNLQYKSYVKRCAEATREKKILNDGLCAMSLTNSIITLLNKTGYLHQTKLKTDSQNRFISSGVFFV
jgi:hypothetical protein